LTLSQESVRPGSCFSRTSNEAFFIKRERRPDDPLVRAGRRFAAAAAGAGSLLIAVVVLVLEIGPPWHWPGPSDLLLPAVG
jgi:hypothetical protein